MRKLLLVLSLPFLIATLGLFVQVINALLLLFVGQLVKGFGVDGFWSAFWGSLVISVVSIVTNLLVGRGPRIEVRRGGSPRRPSGRDDNNPGGGGPVIDV